MIFGMDWINWNKACRRITVSCGIIVVLVLASTLAAIGTEMADLSVRDWLVAGDGKLTYDHSTGLEWLDLTETLDHSVVTTEALPFFEANGADGKFRWATESEIANLLAAPGVPFSDYETYYSINVAEASTLIDLLGGVPYGGGLKVAGVSREDEPSPGAYAVSHVFVIGSEAQIVHPTPPLACCISELTDYPDVGAWLVRSTASVLNPSIDIKPGSDPNCFNNNGHGVIPVAILGSADFDVTQVDPATVELQGLAVRVVGKKGNLQAHIEDSNGDGFDDLVVQIEDEDGVFAPGDGTATLTGQLFDGTPFEGTDSICVVP